MIMPPKTVRVILPGVTISGDDLAEALGLHIDEVMDAAEGALTEIADEIMTDSKENYVPVDTGNLKKSGQVEDPVRTPDGISVTMGYGGAAAEYAAAVHEHPSPASPPSWRLDPSSTDESEFKEIQWTKPGTGPKYLQTPFFERASRIPADLAERIRIRTRGR